MTAANRILVPVDARTSLVTLIGDPVSHSLSPLIHNAAFREHDLNFAYVAMRVEESAVSAAVAGLRALEFAGANVTAPHKQAVIPELDRISEQARAVGAVNTIVRHEHGRLEGDNTDIAGFLTPLLPYADRLRSAPITVLGAGGAARAVAYALLTSIHPERITLAARTPEKAERIAADLAEFDASAALNVSPYESCRDEVRRSSLIVNATPAGTHPNVDDTPWTHPEDFSSDQIVYDLVYNPRETRLLREAYDRGAATIEGLEMLISQAAAAYAQWTGREMPTHVVREALRISSS